MGMNETQRVLIPLEEERSISRIVMAWINGFPSLPETINIVAFEQLPAGKSGMAVSVVPGAYIKQRFITGGYRAEYSFSVVFRILPGASNDARLLADEVLNHLGDWATLNPPNLGENIKIRSVQFVERAALLVPYEDGSEDHSMTIKLIYEVIQNA